MTDDEPESSIRTAGRPEITDAGREVFSFHLHRYISSWLRQTGCQRVLVTVGFGCGRADLGAYRIGPEGGQSVRTGWTHQDLQDAWRFGDGRLVWEAPSGESIVFDVVAVVDDPDVDLDTGAENTGNILGFATVRRDEHVDQPELRRLADQIAEAVRVARRNGVRLFFEEEKNRAVKDFLYAALQRLPEWTGCDHSAAVLLTHDLDAMTLEDTTDGAFDVLAERIFFEGADDPDRPRPRLVGMAVDTDDSRRPTILGDALRRYRQDPESDLFLYRRPGGEQSWGLVESDDAPLLRSWYEMDGRPGEETVMLVPLVSRLEDESDFFGFLSVSWGGAFGFPPSLKEVVDGIRENLARHLKQSPLYTLSVRKLWLVRQVRSHIEEAIASEARGEKPIEEVIGRVSSLVAEHVDVPSFAMGYLRGADDERVVRYAHPHGWTRFDQLDLRVDVADDERVDSGISALALRLERPVVLAGGYGEGTDQQFKNHLWVDENAGRLYDDRRVEVTVDELEEDCRPLADYYKPARETAYATLAYPMVFSGVQLGVLTVEVEKTTDWVWWTGFGGHLFWGMLAREMAMLVYWLRE